MMSTLPSRLTLEATSKDNTDKALLLLDNENLVEILSLMLLRRYVFATASFTLKQLHDLVNQLIELLPINCSEQRQALTNALSRVQDSDIALSHKFSMMAFTDEVSHLYILAIKPDPIIDDQIVYEFIPPRLVIQR